MKMRIPYILSASLALLLAVVTTLYFQTKGRLKKSRLTAQESIALYQDSLSYYKAIENASALFFQQDYESSLDAFIRAERTLYATQKWHNLVLDFMKFDGKRNFATDSLRNLNLLLNSQKHNLDASVEELEAHNAFIAGYIDTLKQELIQSLIKSNEYLLANKKLEEEIEVLKKSYGKLSFINTEGKSVDFFGEIQSNLANGYGIAIFDNKGFYAGEWRNNQRHGKGKYIWKNGDMYEGEFREGRIEGSGTYSFSSGEKYVGEWKNNVRNGKGVFYAKEGNVLLDGIWAEDKYVRQNK
jgi:hypothetical protein